MSEVVERLAKVIVKESRKPGVGISNPQALIRAALTELTAMGLVVVEKEPSDENLGIHPAMDVNAARKYRQESFALIARLASKVQP